MRVLHVLRLDLAADRLGEHDALLDLHRDGLAVRGDLGLAVGEVRHRLGLLPGRIREEPAVHRVHDPDRVRVVRLAGIHVVHVAAGQDGQLAALLALRRVLHVVERRAGEELLGDVLRRPPPESLWAGVPESLLSSSSPPHALTPKRATSAASASKVFHKDLDMDYVLSLMSTAESARRSWPSLPARVEGVLEPVAHEVEGQHGEEERDAREEHEPPGIGEQVGGVGDHPAP